MSGMYYGDGWGKVELVGHDLTYTVHYATGENGPQVTGLCITSENKRPITVDDLRSIPLRRLAAAVAQMDDSWQPHVPDFSRQPEKVHVTAGCIPVASRLHPNIEAAHERRNRRINDELLREVSEIARAAFSRGQRVRDVVAQHFNAAPCTVDKWLARARAAGHLRAGELSRKRQ